MGIARMARSLKRRLVSSGTVADQSGVAQRETAVAPAVTQETVQLEPPAPAYPVSQLRTASNLVSARHAEDSVIASMDDLEPSHDEFLIRLLIESARRAMTVDMSSVAARCKTEDDAR